MAGINSTFSDRLNEAFAHRGINTTPEKITRLRSATGCSARTAKRWLYDGVLPRTAGPLVQIGCDLDVNLDWLIIGDGPSPLTQDFLKKLEKVPPHYIPKLTRYFIRLNNKDAKALRWSKMADRGELSFEQIMAMA